MCITFIILSLFTMALKSTLTQEQELIQRQQQLLTAQQILQVKLLEMPLAQLEEKVREELIVNPALEKEAAEEGDDDVRTAEGDVNGSADYDVADAYESADGAGEEADGSADLERFEKMTEKEDRDQALDEALDSIDSDDRLVSDYRQRSNNSHDSSENEEMVYGDTESFRDKLMEQVAEVDISQTQRTVMEYLIGMLDDDGLLRTDLSVISDNLAIYYYLDVSPKEVENVLHILQTFDPVGVGARSLQECLLLQIEQKKDSPLKKYMCRVIRDYYEEFTRKHWEKLSQHLGISEYEMDEVIAELRRLNPRPGSSLGETMGRSVNQVTPDFIIDSREDGTVSFSLNMGDLPRLYVSPDYEEMLRGYQMNAKSLSRSEKSALLFYKEKVESARGYIDAIERRQKTMTATMKAIIDIQRRYFIDGDEADLVPMTEKDVAERIGMDISTVSRVCKSKYAETPWGIFRLRHFFSSGYSVDGETEMSNRRIKAALTEIIKAEDKKRPLSDDAIAKELKKQGFPIARRTVAKYRDALNIPVARLRR